MSKTSETETEETPSVEFTAEQHEQINAIVARRTREAAEKAAKEREDAINAYLAEQAEEANRAEMAEIDRVKAQLADAETAAEKAKADREASEKLAQVTSALYRANVNVDVLDDAIRLVDTTVEDVNVEVDALKQRLPALFTDKTVPPAPHTSLNPGNDKRTPGGKTAVERARERATAMGILSNAN